MWDNHPLQWPGAARCILGHWKRVGAQPRPLNRSALGIARNVVNLRDRVRFGSDAEAINSLRDLASQLQAVGTRVPVRDKSDYCGFALTHLVGYASGQLSRLASLYQAGIELHAWTARNLFEACLLSECFLQEPSKAREFVAQKASDELQINEGFIGLSEDPNAPALRPILERNNHIRHTLAKHALPEARPWSVSSLAKLTHNETDYDAFFKLYSKYVHPSSWLVFAAPNEADTPVLRNIFLVQAQYYGARILKLAQDVSSAQTGSPSEDVDA